MRDQLARMAHLADRIDIVVADGGSTDGSLDADTLGDFRLRALLVKRGLGRLSAQMRMAISFMLAPSKPRSMNTFRAPSRIWRRLDVSSSPKG